ncbi:helix-turn-helix transcriptional regulator [Nonomuraea sp. KM88]|uniref:helix-turn-helix transcriptional regulator n=1 Tax=Nonomuraea sp. KM88 TaxID=3457427 RepID=UPI003FCE53E1
MLYGRDAELRRIQHLIEAVRAGGSAALLLTGEPGTGKTALLDHSAGRAEGVRVLRVHGVESEADLPFAALHQLLRPLLPGVRALPGPQAAALSRAFGLAGPGDGGPAAEGAGGRLLVSLGMLTLLGDAAEETPVLCVVDDAHWLDVPSADALGFVGRRLTGESIGLLFAVRDGSPARFPGLPELPVRGLDHASASAFLAERHPELAAHVRERIAAAAGGNPLALADLPTALTADQRTAHTPLLGPLPIPDHLRRLYADRVRDLPADTATLLLVAAAEDGGELAAVLRAAGELGVRAQALDAAERAGIVTIEDTADGRRVVFRHPLVRTAVYHDAPFSRRLAVHRALARALDPERGAWHRAAAATGPDAEVARDLERGALRALRRGAPGTAAVALERAAWLTASAPDRAALLVSAAEAAGTSGDPELAEALAGQAERAGAGPEGRARLGLLRASAAFDRGSPADVHRLLLDRSAPIARTYPELAATMLLDAVKNGWFLNDPARTRSASEALAAVPLPHGSPLTPLVGTVLALGQVVDGAGHPVDGMENARPPLGAVTPETPLGAIMTAAAAMVGDDVGLTDVAGEAVRACRAAGRIGWLPLALQLLASAELLSGRHHFAAATAAEGLDLAVELGQDNRACHFRGVLAWLDAVAGEEESCRERAMLCLRHAEAQRIPPSAAIASWALGLLDLSLGHADEALAHLLPHAAVSGGHPLIAIMQTPDLVEAAARAGRADLARPHLARYAAWSARVRRDWALAALHRCSALLADHDDAESHFERALELHDRAGLSGRPRAFDHARTRLAYGEWLRRARRRADARGPLQAAFEAFDRLGATAWAERANAELRATGHGSKPAATATAGLAALTPQELQVVRMATTGASNREIAAHLFLSPRTVAYHLYKAFPKLGVTSRVELAALLHDRPSA